MLSFLSGRKDYQPVFKEGDSLIIHPNQVPKTVTALAKSFRNDKGERVNIENYWLFTGSGKDTLDQARFVRTIGFHISRRIELARIIDSTARTFPAIAINPKTKDIGIRLVSLPNESETGFMIEMSMFISRGHLSFDRPLAANLNPDLQRQLVQATGKTIEKVSDEDLFSFVLNHQQREEVRYSNGNGTSSGSEKLVTIPSSMTEIKLIGTQYSYHPLRSFMEQMKENKYASGELIADGHIHEALSPKRIGGDPWLQQLAQRYGPVRASATLSLFDVDQLLQMENHGVYYGVPWVQYAAREIFVINDEGEVKAHSVLNMAGIMNDEQRLNRFVNVSKTSLSAPVNADYRLKFHDMILDFTTQKNVDEPLTPKDYATL